MKKWLKIINLQKNLIILSNQDINWKRKSICLKFHLKMINNKKSRWNSINNKKRRSSKLITLQDYKVHMTILQLKISKILIWNNNSTQLPAKNDLKLNCKKV